MNSRKSIRDFIDGTSNSLVVGEYSGLAKTQKLNSTTETPLHCPYGNNIYQGWFSSTEYYYQWPGTGPTYLNASYYSALSAYYLTGYRFVLYGPNLAFPNLQSSIYSQPPYNACGGKSADANDYAGSDASLKSSHVGGVHALMGDGAVRFISENIAILTLQNLADIDDRQTLGEF